MSGVGFLQYLEKGAANSSSSSVSSAGAPATTQGSAKESPRGHADTSRVSAPAARESITHRLAAKDVELLFSSLCSKKVNGIEVSHLYSALESHGVRRSDPRIKKMADELKDEDVIFFERFQELLLDHAMVDRVLKGRVAIQDFRSFTDTVKEAFKAVEPNTGGHVATYIPQLARVNPDQLGVAVCSVDGQQYSIGDDSVPFCVQSCSKAITYAIALEFWGQNKVHQHVGFEPSGRNFNELCLDEKRRPHNPMINSGAIMAVSLCFPSLPLADRFDKIVDYWSRLAGGTPIGFANSTYLSEAATADRNFCLAYMMNEAHAFPEGTNLQQTLELYFMLCSLTVTATQMALIAATLAAGGTNPITEDRIFSNNTVRNCLSLMSSSGMYDYSGEFAFTMGFPSKSGVAGALMVVIPGVMGICTFSPRLDPLGNSVRGIDFCKQLSSKFALHTFDSLVGLSASEQQKKAIIRHAPSVTSAEELTMFWFACYKGDMRRIRWCLARGIDINQADYDNRTALGIAASEGRENVVEYLLLHGAATDLADRYGNKPIDDAKRGKHRKVVKRLQHRPLIVDCEDPLLRVLIGSDGRPLISLLSAALTDSGLSLTDPRVVAIYSKIGALSKPDEIDPARFGRIPHEDLLARALQGRLAVKKFSSFARKLDAIIRSQAESLRSSDGKPFGLSVCTVDGQRYDSGSTTNPISVDTISEVVTYAIALEIGGTDLVHKYIGREPSGRTYNELALNADSKPYNPFVRSGAIMAAALIKPDQSIDRRFEYLLDVWQELMGGQHRPKPSSQTKTKNHLNYALAYMMSDKGAFPEGTDLETTLSLHTMLSSMELSCEDLSVVAATLANGGVNPFTNVRVFSPATVRSVLCMMQSCGSQNYSGEFSFRIGFPVRCTGSALVMIIIPNLLGCCLHAPGQQKAPGVYGMSFCQALSDKFSFHMYHNTLQTKETRNPGDDGLQKRLAVNSAFWFAAARGLLPEVQRLVKLEEVDVNVADYDSRTALHLAASENHVDTVLYLLEAGANPTATDRWGNTAYDDALRGGYSHLCAILAPQSTQATEKVSAQSQQTAPQQLQQQAAAATTNAPPAQLKPERKASVSMVARLGSLTSSKRT